MRSALECSGLPLWSAAACCRFGVRWLATALGWAGYGGEILIEPPRPTHPKAAVSCRTPKRQSRRTPRLLQRADRHRARGVGDAGGSGEQLGARLDEGVTRSGQVAFGG